MDSIVKLEDVFIGYPKADSDKVIAGPINLSLFAGQFVCLIGANGSGKTTLLRNLCGVQKPLSGKIKIHSKDISDYRPSALAKLLSVVLTERVNIGNLSVYGLVALGRYPYTNWLGGLTYLDKQIIAHALESTHTLKFSDRRIGELSDGELQKVMIARALAQDTDIILLDEPTAHLDLQNRLEIFQLLRKLAKETGKTVLLSTHELDLALQSADHIWLINQQFAQEVTEDTVNQIISGVPEDLVLNGSLKKAFESRGVTFDIATGRFKILPRLSDHVNLYGPENKVFWTAHALERKGFYVDNNKPSPLQIRIDHIELRWFGQLYEENFSVDSLEELLEKLDRNKKQQSGHNSRVAT